MEQQGKILQEVTHLVDAGKLQGTASEVLNGLNVETLQQAHIKVQEGHMRGKVTIAKPSLCQPSTLVIPGESRGSL
ncbi:MAG: zinc-binding dehydrogenase [Symbiopectobacterium sp.]|uniref:zinc-binding dehydrogenase n=1 Tax=Symbiopectobacterium sp. TaxID=2952789 RepID=UPI003F2F0B71